MGEKSTTLAVTADKLVARLLSLEASAKLFLLDSCGRSLGGSKLLIAGIYPTESVEFNCQTQADAFAALKFLDEKLTFYTASNNFSLLFGGGICAATFAYKFGLLLENLSPRTKEFVDQKEEPSATFSFYETFLVHDYAAGETKVIGRDAVNFAQILSRSDDQIAFVPPNGEVVVSSNLTEPEYLAAVEKIRRHIALGDIYQANLTQQLTIKLPEKTTSEQVFWNLRQSHPAPFAAFVRREQDCIVSASPERFLQVQKSGGGNHKRIVITSPVKGTRQRGITVAEDLRLRRELEQSAKDKAENVMIVDLLRNDLGRVCRFGSVKPEKLFEIEEHPTLFHLVSTVRGELRQNAKISDLLRATFPCGSITGAPKIRAMQILDEIETAPRGISMGAIGYFGFDNSLDLSVAIRTMTIRRQTAVFNVGGGIVAGSEPQAEYNESWLKAQALINAAGKTRKIGLTNFNS